MKSTVAIELNQANRNNFEKINQVLCFPFQLKIVSRPIWIQREVL